MRTITRALHAVCCIIDYFQKRHKSQEQPVLITHEEKGLRHCPVRISGSKLNALLMYAFKCVHTFTCKWLCWNRGWEWCGVGGMLVQASELVQSYVQFLFVGHSGRKKILNLIYLRKVRASYHSYSLHSPILIIFLRIPQNIIQIYTYNSAKRYINLYIHTYTTTWIKACKYKQTKLSWVIESYREFAYMMKEIELLQLFMLIVRK